MNRKKQIDRKKEIDRQKKRKIKKRQKEIDKYKEIDRQQKNVDIKKYINIINIRFYETYVIDRYKEIYQRLIIDTKIDSKLNIYRLMNFKNNRY